MTKNFYKIIWSHHAKADLKNIHQFIKKQSTQGANRVITDIRQSMTSITFAEQYQVDEYMPVCRRMVVINYKILYTFNELKKEIYIIRVFDARQNPKKLEED